MLREGTKDGVNNVGMILDWFRRGIDPCFAFRPDIFIRACLRKLQSRPERKVVKSAWGTWVEVEPRKFIGSHVYMRGVHELPVCEALWRLTDKGETVVDVGANIGVMTSILALKTGCAGRVFAFEPHPEQFRRLQGNVGRWDAPQIQVSNKAVSNCSVKRWLQEESCFDNNEGTAKLSGSTPGGRAFEVQSIALDEAMPGNECRLVKIDVEGHELAVLSGARRLLESGRMRDIVFESTKEYPGRAHELLLWHGYRIFALKASFWGPMLTQPMEVNGFEGKVTDYLATLDPQRAQQRLGPRGWKILKRAWIMADRPRIFQCRTRLRPA